MGYSLTNTSDGTFSYTAQQCRKCRQSEFIVRPNEQVCTSGSAFPDACLSARCDGVPVMNRTARAPAFPHTLLTVFLLLSRTASRARLACAVLDPTRCNQEWRVLRGCSRTTFTCSQAARAGIAS